MEIINKKVIFKQQLALLKKQHKTIGFVPTMGALHQGHYALLQQAKAENDILVCSIFVNPTQFNNLDDLKKYPRDIQKDCDLIKDICDFVFIPSVEEIYPETPSEVFDFGYLDKVMEGAFRPGHFNGVAMVVKRLFEIILPDVAYFGKKDFQQTVIIKKLIEIYSFSIKIIVVDTIRENDGLAFSSRNMLLSKEKRLKAPFIYQTMLKAKTFVETMTPREIEQWIAKQFSEDKDFTLEYAEIVNAENLLPIQHFTNNQKVVLCVAAYLDKIRLIDNLELIKI